MGDLGRPSFSLLLLFWCCFKLERQKTRKLSGLTVVSSVCELSFVLRWFPDVESPTSTPFDPFALFLQIRLKNDACTMKMRRVRRREEETKAHFPLSYVTSLRIYADFKSIAFQRVVQECRGEERRWANVSR